jgi:hypothetical protein
LDRALFITFCAVSIINVIIQTIKSILTVKRGVFVPALISGIAYGINPIVVMYTVCELPLELKCLVFLLTNFAGVAIVKFFEKKFEKDKLWKFEATIDKEHFKNLLADCKHNDLSFLFIDINKYYSFHVYCATREESTKVKNILKKYDAKIFIIESQKIS